MPVTRDPNYPAEAAALFQAFNRCSDGHDAQMVLDATINFLICGIAYHAKDRKLTEEQTEAWIAEIAACVSKGVKLDVSGEKPADAVPVPIGGH